MNGLQLISKPLVYSNTVKRLSLAFDIFCPFGCSVIKYCFIVCFACNEDIAFVVLFGGRIFLFLTVVFCNVDCVDFCFCLVHRMFTVYCVR
jgi:hypothetical protein